MHFIWRIWSTVLLIYLDYTALVHVQRAFHNSRIVPAAEAAENKCFMWNSITVSKQDANFEIEGSMILFFLSVMNIEKTITILPVSNEPSKFPVQKPFFQERFS